MCVIYLFTQFNCSLLVWFFFKFTWSSKDLFCFFFFFCLAETVTFGKAAPLLFVLILMYLFNPSGVEVVQRPPFPPPLPAPFRDDRQTVSTQCRTAAAAPEYPGHKSVNTKRTTRTQKNAAKTKKCSIITGSLLQTKASPDPTPLAGTGAIQTGSLCSYLARVRAS